MTTPALKLVVRGTLLDTIEWRNIFYYTTTSDYTPTTITNWVTGLYNTILSPSGNQMKIYGVDVATRLAGTADTDPLGWGASEFITVSLQGANPGELLPPADAYVVIGQTGVKHVMARKFLPGLVEAGQANGILASNVLSAAVAFGAYWLAPTAQPAGSDCVASSWGPTHGFVPLISTKASNRVFHLDRRQVGRGI